MILQAGLDCLARILGDAVARLTGWTPLGKAVAFTFDDSDDQNLLGRRVHGTVRASDAAGTMLLVQLTERIDYEGHYTARSLDMIVAAPAVRWHRANRLLLAWSVVRLVDAPSFALQGFGRTIGTGRLVLDRQRSRDVRSSTTTTKWRSRL